jgi:hypothetical protein
MDAHDPWNGTTRPQSERWASRRHSCSDSPDRRACARSDTSHLEIKPMIHEIKPLPFDPKAIDGLSKEILVSHCENNYIRAIERLNAIGGELAELDYAKAPVFMINGQKREALIDDFA